MGETSSSPSGYMHRRVIFTSQSRRVAEPSYPVSEVVSTPAEEQSLSLKSPRQALPLSREFTTLKDKCQTFAPSAALRGIMFSAINGYLVWGGGEVCGWFVDSVDKVEGRIFLREQEFFLILY